MKPGQRESVGLAVPRIPTALPGMDDRKAHATRLNDMLRAYKDGSSTSYDGTQEGLRP